MKVLWGSALAIAVFGSACAVDAGPAPPTERTVSQAIINGDTSDPNEFPATGMVVFGGHAVCTGTLIAPDVVLTAAHCLDAEGFGGFGFSLDTDGIDGIDDIVTSAVQHAHPSFDSRTNEFTDVSVRNDIGVLMLDAPVVGIEPEKIEQPEDNAVVDAGTELSLCGYGRFVWRIAALPHKRDARIVIDRSEPFEFSTTAVDPQPCKGDSGGPLFAETAHGRRIVGVVSRAMGRSEMCDTGGIITRVKPYDDWLFLASHDHNTGGCSAGGGSAAIPFGLIALAAVRRRRRGSR